MRPTDEGGADARLFDVSPFSARPDSRGDEEGMRQPAAAPKLRSYDAILFNSSGGKDSQASLDYVVQAAREAGVPKKRIVVVHADLRRMEWEGTAEIAELQAMHYGLRFLKVSRKGGDLLDRVEERGMWPDAARRWCTSDFKRSPIRTVMTALVKELRADPVWLKAALSALGIRQARILNVMGMRAEESPKRAKKPAFCFDENASNGRRHVDEWLPIHGWTEAEVWRRVRASGAPRHYVYALGLPRASCCFCILASKSALVKAAQLRPGLAREYLRVEEATGHRFRENLSMREVVELAEKREQIGPVEGWVA